MYIEKVRARVGEYRAEGVATDSFAEKAVKLNGLSLLPWSEIEGRSGDFVRELARDSDFTLVHGDFCMGNILCEPYMGLVKLIDPRGSFGESCVGPYGDRKYDWAKLGHSILGRYDYIVNDLFHVVRNEEGYKMVTYDRPWQNELEELYWSYCEHAGIDRRQIQFIMGSLFLSMTPLHKGRANRQLAFFLQGLKYYTEALR
jgi:hypothetical protein